MRANVFDPADCMCLNVRRAARALSQRYDAALGSCGLTIAQYGLLSAIARRGPLPLTELAGLFVMEKSTVTRNVAGLEAAGLCRTVPGADRRRKLVESTADGREALARARPLWRTAQRELAAELGTQRWHRLLADARLLAGQSASVSKSLNPSRTRRAGVEETERQRS